LVSENLRRQANRKEREKVCVDFCNRNGVCVGFATGKEGGVA